MSTQKISSLLLTSFLIIFFGNLWIVNPQQQALHAARKQWSEKTNQLADEKTLIEQQKIIRKQVADLKSQMPSTENTINSDINTLAEQNHLNGVNINTSEKNKIILEAKGSYQGLIHFLQQLNNTNHGFVMDNNAFETIANSHQLLFSTTLLDSSDEK